ncbi:ribosome assembly factor SBDS [Candidatus Woesearchaeota archaeon]|nr:ribosome assembly factor SBDS [Candidatus Woesearchaeota archaeon]
MTSVDKAVVAKLRKEGKNFEILVDCEAAMKFKHGLPISIRDVVVTNDIFIDVKKGDKASENDLKKIFRTNDAMEISKIIIKDGEVALTSTFRDKIRKEKKAQIINIIHRNGIDPQTGLPHPPQRIEAAMEQAKVRIDEFKPADQQVEKILEAIKPIIPIKFEMREYAVKISPEYATKCFGILKQYKLLKEEWQNDGSLIALVELPAGISEEFEGRLNSATAGNVEFKVVNKK